MTRELSKDGLAALDFSELTSSRDFASSFCHWKLVTGICGLAVVSFLLGTLALLGLLCWSFKVLFCLILFCTILT